MLSFHQVSVLICSIRNPFEPAQEAFHEALQIFKETLTKDAAKRRLADDYLTTSTLRDVLNYVLDAKKRYDDSASQSRIREGLNAFSQRIMYYGNIMDVLVQHHPEYVSLAWGAMKFIFGVSACFSTHRNNYEALSQTYLQIDRPSLNMNARVPR